VTEKEVLDGWLEALSVTAESGDFGLLPSLSDSFRERVSNGERETVDWLPRGRSKLGLERVSAMLRVGEMFGL